MSLLQQDWQQFEAFLSRKNLRGSLSAEMNMGRRIVTIENVPIPKPAKGFAWNVEKATILFQVPCGYPNAHPEHFWTLEDFTYGTAPCSPSRGSMERYWAWTRWCYEHDGIPDDARWWRLNLQAWNPSRDGLVQYFGAIRHRLSVVY